MKFSRLFASARPTYAVATLGCKVNQCESQWLAAQLEAAGYRPAGHSAAADICIINTCAVTGKSAMQSRQMIRVLQRRHTPGCLVVTGCYAQTEPGVVAAMGGIDYVLGHAEKFSLAQLVLPHAGETDGTRILCNTITAATVFEPAAAIPVCGSRSRAFLKIQDGCEAYCTYCIVPYARGASRSMTVAMVLAQIETLTAAGYREIVLTGIHLGLYGRNLNSNVTLLTLLQSIKAHSRMDVRLRLSSLEPLELSPPLLALLADGTLFCPHLHIPLQSGDDAILAAMGRPYTRAEVTARVLDVATRLPQAAIGMDVMAGFPGEDEQAFARTCDLLQALPISYLHVFPFSPRPNTPAAIRQPRVPSAAIKARCRQLRELGARKRRAFWENNLQMVRPVLVENRRDTATGLLRGLTDNYIPVLLQGPDSLKNQIIPVTLTTIHDDRVVRAQQ